MCAHIAEIVERAVRSHPDEDTMVDALAGHDELRELAIRRGVLVELIDGIDALRADAAR